MANIVRHSWCKMNMEFTTSEGQMPNSEALNIQTVVPEGAMSAEVAIPTEAAILTENPNRNTAKAVRMSSIRNIQSSLDVIQQHMTETIKDQQGLTSEICGRHGVSDRLDLLSEEVSDSTFTITETLAKQESMVSQMNLLVGIVTRQSEQIKRLQSEVLDLKSRSMRQNVLFHGIPESPSEDPYTIVTRILTNDLKIKEVENMIDVCHRMGPTRPPGSKPRPIVTRFVARRDTEEVLWSFKEYDKARNPKTHDRKSLWISPHFPEEILERRRQLGNIIKETKKKSPSAQCKLSVGDLYVNNEKYRDPVSVPTPRSLLTMDKDECKAIDDMKLAQGQTITEKGSTFTAQAKKIRSISEVRLVYKKMFKDTPTCGATHNILVYALPDGTIGYHDDGETGAGRFLTRWLSRKDVKGVAVVVTRFYGGTRLGFKRFQLIKQSADAVIDILQ